MPDVQRTSSASLLTLDLDIGLAIILVPGDLQALGEIADLTRGTQIGQDRSNLVSIFNGTTTLAALGT